MSMIGVKSNGQKNTGTLFLISSYIGSSTSFKNLGRNFTPKNIRNERMISKNMKYWRTSKKSIIQKAILFKNIILRSYVIFHFSLLVNASCAALSWAFFLLDHFPIPTHFSQR